MFNHLSRLKYRNGDKTIVQCSDVTNVGFITEECPQELGKGQLEKIYSMSIKYISTYSLEFMCYAVLLPNLEAMHV